jgi:ligand-binding SRPBCC domain-containing protein
VKLFILKRRQLVRRPLPEVFAFFSKPENLEVLTPKTLGFRILTPSPVNMKEGAVIDYTIAVAGFPVRWTTLISSYEPQHRFVDLQLKGPYSFWHHTHTFTETENGTLIDDEVRYSMPYGALGVVAHALFVKRQLRTIFARRSDVISTIFPEQGNTGLQKENMFTRTERAT